MSAVSVVGLGKLGCCLAALLAERGHNVVGLDLNLTTIQSINDRTAPFNEPGLQTLMTKVAPKLKATAAPRESVRGSDIAFIVVPTPSDDEGRFANRHILDAIEAMGPFLKKKAGWYTIVVCSTVMPGSMDGPIRDQLEAVTGKQVGIDIGLAYSPEFIALGSVIKDMRAPDMILVGAGDERSRTEALSVLSGIPDAETPVMSLSCVDAELAKIAINTYITMKISYANTLAEICEKLPGARATEVVRAVGADSRIGVKYLQPGGAYGGPCFPRDTVAFSALAKSCETRAQLAEATAEINNRQSVRLADQVCKYDRVAVLGKSYKPWTPVTEQSFALEIIQLLQVEGVRVTAYDPLVHGDVLGSITAPSAQEAIADSQAVIVATAYPEFATLDYGDRPVLDVWGILPETAGSAITKIGYGA